MLVALQAVVLFGLRVAETRVLFEPAELAPSLEIHGQRTLSQTFVAQADGLKGVTVYPATRHPGPVPGKVELTLEDGGTAVARGTFPAAEVAAHPEWTWSFAPVPASARREFRLVIAVPDATERSGLSLTIGPPTYADGVLAIGGRAQWGDLRFQTQSQYSRVVDLLQRRPAVRRGAWVPVAAGAAMIVLAVSLSALAVGVIRDGAAAWRTRP